MGLEITIIKDNQPDGILLVSLLSGQSHELSREIPLKYDGEGKDEFTSEMLNAAVQFYRDKVAEYKNNIKKYHEMEAELLELVTKAVSKEVLEYFAEKVEAVRYMINETEEDLREYESLDQYFTVVRNIYNDNLLYDKTVKLIYYYA